MGYQKAAKITFIAYFTTVFLFDLFLMVDIFVGNQRVTCNMTTDWQIITLIALDTVQTIILITTSIVMYVENKK